MRAQFPSPFAQRVSISCEVGGRREETISSQSDHVTRAGCEARRQVRNKAVVPPLQRTTIPRVSKPPPQEESIPPAISRAVTQPVTGLAFWGKSLKFERGPLSPLLHSRKGGGEFFSLERQPCLRVGAHGWTIGVAGREAGYTAVDGWAGLQIGAYRIIWRLPIFDLIEEGVPRVVPESPGCDNEWDEMGWMHGGCGATR